MHGVASKSSRLINEAKSSVAASRRDINITPWRCQQILMSEEGSILTFHVIVNSLRPRLIAE